MSRVTHKSRLTSDPVGEGAVSVAVRPEALLLDLPGPVTAAGAETGLAAPQGGAGSPVRGREEAAVHPAVT